MKASSSMVVNSLKWVHLLPFLLSSIFPPAISQSSEFISIDCGGTSNYTDRSTGLTWISDAGKVTHGRSVAVGNPDGESPQYDRRRDFPADNGKYCYNLPTERRRRYIVRATFLYGGSENVDTYPQFQLFLDATKWATVTITDSTRTHVKEMVIRAPSEAVDVCLCCATTGSPFISTVELRPLNLSMYATDYEDDFYLKVAARVNFGALSKDPVRYPDDPYDRIWESDLDKRQNFLVDAATGTERINTSKSIDVNTREYPPVKVMQTAVVGSEGTLSYRLNLEDFPGNARAFAYFAEIQGLRSNETRKFKMTEPYIPDYSNAVVNIEENANGRYRLYEPSYMNVSLDFVLSFSFVKTPDSTQGPLLNAMEICKYVEISSKTDIRDVAALKAFSGMSPETLSTEDEGDPCNPKPWGWVACSSTSPPRITKLQLSRKGLTGTIPSGLQNMDGLEELWLNDNSLSGPMPDMSKLLNLRIMHLENNRLSGTIPYYIGALPNLQELYIQNNHFNGKIPPGLLTRKVHFNFEGNPKLTQGVEHSRHFKMILGSSIAALLVIILLLLGSLVLFMRKRAVTQENDGKGDTSRASRNSSATYSLARSARFKDEGVACYIKLSDLEEATANFSRNIGQGSFGRVYYGRMKDGKEIAVKIISDPTSQGTKQFLTEVGLQKVGISQSLSSASLELGVSSATTSLSFGIGVSLLSRIHHRNLVPLIGYCEEANHRMLVYEYMHNGTLRDHIHDPIKQQYMDWLTRLRIAEDAAKGLEYLHTGCNPSIIHRDVKTSNILLDINRRAKVSDFGLSKIAEEDLTHISSVARGTLGYLDPEYYAYQQLTEKSDVYSFGIVLLELISGRKPVSEDYGEDWNIVHWARSLIRKGDVISMIDPVLGGTVKLESVWRVAEVAIQCIEQRGVSRPKMQEVILAIQDAVKMEKGTDKNQGSSSNGKKPDSTRKTLLTSFLEIESPDLSSGRANPSVR